MTPNFHRLTNVYTKSDFLLNLLISMSILIVIFLIFLASIFTSTHNHHDCLNHDDCTFCLILQSKPINKIQIVGNCVLLSSFEIIQLSDDCFCVPSQLSFRTIFPNAPPQYSDKPITLV